VHGSHPARLVCMNGVRIEKRKSLTSGSLSCFPCHLGSVDHDHWKSARFWRLWTGRKSMLHVVCLGGARKSKTTGVSLGMMEIVKT